VSALDAGFFEFGPDELGTTATPDRSRSERIWGHPGLSPAGAIGDRPNSPLMAYRWEHTDAALAEQLDLDAAGLGHAGVRYTNPTNGRDALQRIRTEMYRYRGGATSGPVRTVGSSVWQVFAGTGTVTIGEQRYDVGPGDLFAVPSWVPLTIEARADLDLFRFGDDPVYEALGLARSGR
jgi:gentisate 1,2-dioxygenase